MAKEIQYTDTSGRTEYVNLTNSVGQWYNTVGTAFEAFNAASRTIKCLQMANGAAYVGESNTEWVVKIGRAHV